MRGPILVVMYIHYGNLQLNLSTVTQYLGALRAMSGYVLGFGPSRDIIVEDRRESGKRDLEIADNDDDHDADHGHVAGILLGSHSQSPSPRYGKLILKQVMGDPLPRPSYPYPKNQNKPKKELHWSPWVNPRSLDSSR